MTPSLHSTAVRPLAQEIATSIRATGRLVLYGMGGSHNVNRAAEVLYRGLGIDARTLVASEALLAPLPSSTAHRAAGIAVGWLRRDHRTASAGQPERSSGSA